MKKQITLTLAFAVVCFSATSAFADLIGEYASSGTCSKSEKTQCWFEFKKSGKGFVGRHVVADRMDANKVLCSTKLSVKVHVDTIHGQTSYHGKLGSAGIYIRAFDDGRAEIVGDTPNPKVCKKYGWMGEYGVIGD
jgi:hypothetical protein